MLTLSQIFEKIPNTKQLLDFFFRLIFCWFLISIFSHPLFEDLLFFRLSLVPTLQKPLLFPLFSRSFVLFCLAFACAKNPSNKNPIFLKIMSNALLLNLLLLFGIFGSCVNDLGVNWGTQSTDQSPVAFKNDSANVKG